MSDQSTPETPEPSGKSGATFLGFFDKYAPAEELIETLQRAVLESRRIPSGEAPPTETD